MIAFTPFDGSKAVTKTLLQVLFDEGVITFIAGENPSRIRLLVPVGAVKMEDVDVVIHIIERSMAKVAENRAVNS